MHQLARVMHNVGTITGGANSIAYAIGDKREVVGFSATADANAFHAVLWRVR
jgi:hypothetical protein